MKWYSSAEKERPAEGQAVLISLNDEYHVAVYNAEKNLFIGRDDGRIFDPAKENFRWTEYESPFD